MYRWVLQPMASVKLFFSLMGSWSYHPDVNVELTMIHLRPDDSFYCPCTFLFVTKGTNADSALFFTLAFGCNAPLYAPACINGPFYDTLS